MKSATRSASSPFFSSFATGAPPVGGISKRSFDILVALAALVVLSPIFVLIMAAFVGALLAMMLATAPARAYREAALFRLTWSNIGVSRIARFKCNLSTGGYVLLRLRNMLLTVLTLGFFRPFAMVSEYRMKLESVTVHVKGGVDQVAGRLGRQQPGGIGDALADAAGLDLIG